MIEVIARIDRFPAIFSIVTVDAPMSERESVRQAVEGEIRYNDVDFECQVILDTYDVD